METTEQEPSATVEPPIAKTEDQAAPRAELSAALNKGIKEGMSGAIPARTKVE
jgi:hypothetical protein